MIAITIALLFLLSSVPSTGTTDVKQITVPTAKGDTLYVGGNGSGNYTRIQDAIDDASDGDMVFVYDNSSPYYENVVVDKSINLIGENRNTTVIDGDGIRDVVYISADWVNISEFTIRNSGESWGYAGIAIRSNYNTITCNNIKGNNGDGIDLYDSSSNNITGNIISSNKEYGINLESSSSNNITGNIISLNKEYGINLWSSSNNSILGNCILNNFGGLYLYRSENNIIEKNNFIGNRIHVFFWLAWRNTLDSNYWDNWIGLFPKVIVGFLGINFDWHPAKEPYDIP